MTPEEKRLKNLTAQGRLKDLAPEARAEVSREGGLSVSRDLDHMRRIGREGGKKRARDRAEMQRIGALGGKAPRKK